MNHLFCSWGFGWVDKAQFSDRLDRCRWFEPGLQVPGFSRHLASGHLSRNTLFICLQQFKLFRIIQHYSTTTCSTYVFQMFSASVCIEDRLWEHPLAGGLALPSWAEDIWTSKISLATEKSLNFGVFATLNLKFFWGSSPRPPQNVTPLSNTLATCLDHGYHRHSRWLYIQQQSSSSSSNRRFFYSEHDISTRNLGLNSSGIHPS